MRIITHTCPDCGTIVAANELEAERELHCPGLACDAVLAFADLPVDAREQFLANREEYTL